MFTQTSHRLSRARARRAAQFLNEHPGQVAAEEIRILIAAAEHLVARLAKAADPELIRLRRQTEAALAGAQAALAESGALLRDQATELAERGEAYVRQRPWTSISVAALCVLAIGLWTGRALTSD
jgi:ElaB/YqjD/DUF883 family membrane-anchored ribosome-binding protein